MSRVLVLDGAQRSALAVTRSLGRQGMEVLVADAQMPCLASKSRYASAQLSYPDPLCNPEAFTVWLKRTIEDLAVDFVFPTTDATTMLVASYRQKTEKTQIVCAPKTAYERVTDKASLIRLALSAEVTVPATIIALSLQEIETHLENSHFPIVLKPARSRVATNGRILSTSVYVAKSLEDGLKYVRQQPWIGIIPCLIQEYIDGHGAGIFTLYSRGRAIAWFAHRRIREKPPQGGVSVLSESTAFEPLLRAAAERLLNAAEWDGPAMVEFRVSTSGAPYLMEVNGRLWGSLQLPIDCGVDFPWLMLQATDNRAMPIVDTYAVNRRLRWFMGDVDNLLLELRGKGMAQTFAHRLRSIWRFVASTFDSKTRNEIFRLDDVKPALFELSEWFKKLK